jgi:cytochrome P450
MTAEWPSFTDPVLVNAPYPVYAQMHAEAPVTFDLKAFGFSAWIAASHPVVGQILRDPRMSADRSMAHRMFLPDTEDGQLVGKTIAGVLAFRDPPSHTRLRGLISQVFTPRAVDALRPRIEQLVEDLLPPPGEFDLMQQLAMPMPMTVICDLLGIPRADADRIKPWVDDYAMFFGAIRGVKRALTSIRSLHTYFHALFEERKKNLGDDLLSGLIRAEQAGDRLTADELFDVVSFLFVAGHHTTTNLIGNGTLALLRNPDQLAILQNDPAKVPHAIEELLRYDSPVQWAARIAREELDLAGNKVEAGQMVVTAIGAACHDPKVFSDPLKLDVTRANANKHLAFGGGIHFCIGAPLARLEGQIAFGAMMRKYRRLELVGEPEWIPNVNLRGLKTLRVRAS